MSTQQQPKFKFGQKVQVSVGGINEEPSEPFVINCISDTGEYFSYRQPSGYWTKESDLTEVKEPLKAKFECEWGGDEHCVPYPRDDESCAALEPFLGKRTRVTIEEII